jgi:predicted O-methyltransferase YrrM
MPEQVWADVDEFFSANLLPADEVLRATLETNVTEKLPPIAVTPPQGKLLHLLARACGARRILEIGTLGAYSTIWMARALPADGRLVTLEADPKHAEIARSNIARAGVSHLVDVRVGPAIDTLPRLEKDGVAPFDLIFIDADKPSTPDYFEWAIKLSHPGSVIIVDNLVRGGRLIDEKGDEDIQGMRQFMDRLATDTRVNATALQTVGVKGYDGFAIAVVEGGR